MAREEEGHLTSSWEDLCLCGLGVVGGTEGWMSSGRTWLRVCNPWKWGRGGRGRERVRAAGVTSFAGWRLGVGWFLRGGWLEGPWRSGRRVEVR